ncbi:DUF3857 domain-containing protein [Tamlana sp. I1]|uniref:DUF3857 domain-containing protein n=1 Tax=Tamlana sp. I1 TaxID=2762061 RepID=UPI00188E48B6|nr:DUF3857 domain-containing protein [Tamlana sp. I1]
MIKKLFILFLLTSLQTYSQEPYNSESFKVTLDDLKASTFLKDSTANALVIYEYGNSYVDKLDYKLKTEKKFKIKILNQEGFSNANVLIHLYNKNNRAEEVDNILATTYNQVNGKVETTKLKEEHIYREEYDKNHTLVKFTLPNIKAGSVITYGYTITSPYMFKYHGWDFQSEIPKLYSEYNTSIPAYWKYHIKLVGGKNLAVNDADLKRNCLEVGRGGYADCAIGKYVMKDVPAFIEEDYTTTKQNYLARLEYELETFQDAEGVKTHYTKTWEDVDKELRTDKDIGRQLRKSVDLEDFLSNETITETDALKKTKAIYNYVQSNYTWNEEYNIFNEVAIKELIENKSGNVSSINILLHNLLKEAGIDVYPVLLSTRNNGFPTYLYPVLSEYNYLIVQATINDQNYLLDATDPYLNFGQLPFRCLNTQGRLFDFKNESKWIDLTPNTATSSYYILELNFDESNNLSGKINSKKTGYHALNSKKDYFKNKDAYLKALENSMVECEISDFQTHTENINHPDFQESYYVNQEIENVGNKIYLNPLLIHFFKENPFKLQERTYPIDFGYKDTYLYNVTLKVADSYSITEVPKTVALQLPNSTGNIIFSAKKYNNIINMTLKISFKEAVYHPNFYPYLKEFMDKIIDIQNNSIIILSKNT